MPYRSTQKKAKARSMARQLYIKEGLSLEEVSQSTGETVKTLRAWRNLGEWDFLKGSIAKPELDRLQELRGSLFDRIEAQLKDNKLPHTEIGLLAKVDRMIERQEIKRLYDPGLVVLAMLELLIDEVRANDPALLQALIPSLESLKDRLFSGGIGDILT